MACDVSIQNLVQVMEVLCKCSTSALLLDDQTEAFLLSHYSRCRSRVPPTTSATHLNIDIGKRQIYQGKNLHILQVLTHHGCIRV